MTFRLELDADLSLNRNKRTSLRYSQNNNFMPFIDQASDKAAVWMRCACACLYLYVYVYMHVYEDEVKAGGNIVY